MLLNKRPVLLRDKKIKIFQNPFVLVDNGILLCYNIDTENKGGMNYGDSKTLHENRLYYKRYR